ncbi:MAG: hypothetical protein IH965_05045 [Gemmatimonadetes bacterium]|nr:hypothetical protein [Gemmatimonadota bacterium]
MSRDKPPRTRESTPSFLEQARDELFSHILRCGVLQAVPDDQKEWFDDTMEYLAERYEGLSEAQLTEIRRLGERYCQPVIQHNETVGAPN